MHCILHDARALPGRSSVGRSPGRVDRGSNGELVLQSPARNFVSGAAVGRFGMTLALCVILAGCNAPPPPPQTPPVPAVRVVELTLSDVVEYQYFTGRTDAMESVDVRARVTGYLMKVGFKPGDEVSEKQQLFQIDPRPYQAELDRVRSQVLLGQAKKKLAEADVNRTRDISKTPGAISKQDVDRYSSALAEAEATVKAAEAMVQTAELNLGFTDVVSPIAGRVGRNLITVGNLVVQDQTLLTTIVSEDPMYAYFDVDERTMLRMQKMIREGTFREADNVDIRFGLASEQAEYPHQGKLDFVNNRVNTSTGTLQIRAVLPNPKPTNNGPRLLTPGLFVRVRLGIGEPKKGLVITQSAIGSDQSRKYLLVVNNENTVEYRPITVGPIQPDGSQFIEPISVIREENVLRPARNGEKGEPSIKPGEKVIVGGMQRVRPGVVVQPKPFVSAATPATAAK